MTTLRLVIALLTLFTLCPVVFAAEKEPVIHGTVLGLDGRPLAGVDVAMSTHGGGWPQIRNGRLAQRREPYTISTDRNGRFEFAHIDFEEKAKHAHGCPDDRPIMDFILLFLHDDGFLRLTQPEWEALGENKTITLQPWGRLEGTVKVGTQPGKNLRIVCAASFDNEGRPFFSNEPPVVMDYDAVTSDESGKFVFERLPASFVRVSRSIIFSVTEQTTSSGGPGFGFAMRSHNSLGSHGKIIELAPGETATVTIGGVGRPVIGRLTLSSELRELFGEGTEPDWNFSHIVCAPVLEKFDHAAHNERMFELVGSMIPKEINEESDPEKVEKWLETEDGKKFLETLRELETTAWQTFNARNRAREAMTRACAVAADGTFRLDDVPEGDWVLTVWLEPRSAPAAREIPPPPGGRWRLTHELRIAPIPGGQSDEPFDIGTLEIP